MRYYTPCSLEALSFRCLAAHLSPSSLQAIFPLSPFPAAHTKTKDLKSFVCRTYEKHGVGVSKTRALALQPSADTGGEQRVHGSRVTSHGSLHLISAEVLVAQAFQPVAELLVGGPFGQCGGYLGIL